MNSEHSSSQQENSLQFAAALRESFREGYTGTHLRNDILSGITVGIIAIPLAMALAIASGVPPQHGLYTSIVAGIIIAAVGGSRVNISGPTAAFVVILLPITQEFGLGGLLIASVMAGIMLSALGISRMGRLIEFIPYPVTVGFTAGIGAVIATIQIKDFFGLPLGALEGDYFHKIGLLVSHLPRLSWTDTLIGVITFATLLYWHRIRLKVNIPSYLVALVVGTCVATLLGFLFRDFSVATIGSRFSYVVGDLMGQGIPPIAPFFVLPWELPDAQGQPIGLSLALLRELSGPAFAIAMLGAIESLLCAVVADGIAGTRHDPNAELLSQGLGNMVAPFFGGIPATAAIARTAANIRSGGRSPIAAIVHSLVVLLAVVSLAPLMAFVPMASLAALLFMVAWNMSDAKHFVRIVRTAPRSDVMVLLICFGLTVVFDMVIAVTVGMAFASLLFIQRMSALTGTELVSQHEHERRALNVPDYVAVYDINGPLFFGAAEKAIRILYQVNKQVRVVVVDMSDVPMIDMTGIAALDAMLKQMLGDGIPVVITGLSEKILRKLERAGIEEVGGKLLFGESLEEGVVKAVNLVS